MIDTTHKYRTLWWGNRTLLCQDRFLIWCVSLWRNAKIGEMLGNSGKIVAKLTFGGEMKAKSNFVNSAFWPENNVDKSAKTFTLISTNFDIKAEKKVTKLCNE